jgi:hypothetical protein
VIGWPPVDHRNPLATCGRDQRRSCRDASGSPTDGKSRDARLPPSVSRNLGCVRSAESRKPNAKTTYRIPSGRAFYRVIVLPSRRQLWVYDW